MKSETVTVGKEYFDAMYAEYQDLKRAADRLLASAEVGGYSYGENMKSFYTVNVGILDEMYRARNIVEEESNE